MAPLLLSKEPFATDAAGPPWQRHDRGKKDQALFTTQSVSRVVTAAAMAIAALTVSATSAQAATMGFNCITNNSAANCAIGTAQLTAELVDLGNGSVEFLFRNTGPNSASITQIYFDQPSPSIMSYSSMSASSGVSFQSQSNGNLPGGNPFNFAATNRYGATSPVSRNGINPNEWLRLVFTLNQGSSFASLLTNLATGDLRIGMHVQAIGSNSGSEAFINQAVVPEPTSMLLLGTGLAAAAARRRRRQAKAQQ